MAMTYWNKKLQASLWTNRTWLKFTDFYCNLATESTKILKYITVSKLFYNKDFSSTLLHGDQLIINNNSISRFKGSGHGTL